MSDNVIQLRPSIPCDTEPPCEGIDMADQMLKSAQAVEGYKAQHTEPTSSNPFPWWRIHHHNGRCWFRWQKDAQTFEDKEIDEGEALRAIADLALFVRLKGMR